MNLCDAAWHSLSDMYIIYIYIIDEKLFSARGTITVLKTKILVLSCVQLLIIVLLYNKVDVSFFIRLVTPALNSELSSMEREGKRHVSISVTV